MLEFFQHFVTVQKCQHFTKCWNSSSVHWTASRIPVLQSSCLCVQFLTSILLHNWRRMDYIWDSITSHFKLLLDVHHHIYRNVFGDIQQNEDEPHRAQIDYFECLHEAMVESAVIGICKICVRGLQLPCNSVTERILSGIKLLAALSVQHFHHYRNVSYQVLMCGVFGIFSRKCLKCFIFQDF